MVWKHQFMSRCNVICSTSVWAAFAVSAILGSASVASATTMTSSVFFSDTSNDMFGLGADVSFTNRGKFGIPDTVDISYGATVSSGQASAQIGAKVETTIDRVVSLAHASKTGITITAKDVMTQFGGNIGADLFVDMNMHQFTVDLLFKKVTVNPPNLRNVVDKDFNLRVEGAAQGFGTVATDQARIREAGVKTPGGLSELKKYVGVDIDLSATLDVVQSTSFAVTDIKGTLEARHGDGLREIDFSLKDGLATELDLSSLGTWSLALRDLRPEYAYESIFSLDPTARAKLDIFDIWMYDRSRSATLTSTRYTANMDFGRQFIDLGTVSVVAPVPVPASLPMLGAALLGLMALRRRRPVNT